MHMPQDEESSAELRNLAAVPRQIISPANNSSIVGIFQDSLLGTYRITRKGTEFTPRQAMNLLMSIKTMSPDIFASKKDVSALELISQILPPLTSTFKNNSFDDEDKKTSHNVIEIANGVMKRGQLDKTVKKLIHSIFNDFGCMASADFIDDLQNIVTEYMKTSAFSVGISDLIADATTNERIVDAITTKKREVKELLDNVQIGVFENNTGKSDNVEFETCVNSILNKAQEEAGKIGRKNLSKDNRFKIMVQAGSKGSNLNIAQMISCLGQQNVDGKRIPYGFADRTLPHYHKFDDSPGARGFVESSFIQGLTPQELFFHAMGGRVGLIDTAVKTSQTGYVQRRLIKSMEDLKVEYDMTVRNNYGRIVQFTYGDDSIDTTKVEGQRLPVMQMTMEEIFAHFQIPEDITKEALNGINYTKATMTRLKKQMEECKAKTLEYINRFLDAREALYEHVFRGANNNQVNIPVNIGRIILNVKNQLNIQSNSMVDITPLECFKLVENYKQRLHKISSAPPSELFELLYDYYLSPKELLLTHRFSKNGVKVLLETVTTNYKKAIINPGEMVGMVAAQSIGEPTTQLTLNSFTYETPIIVRKNGICNTVPIGEFVESLIAHGDAGKTKMEYYDTKDTTYAPTLDEELWEVQAPNENGDVEWYKIEAGTQHPVVNEDGTDTMVCVTTEYAQEVVATKAKSFLTLQDGKLVCTRGDALKVGDYIPVSTKKIDHDEQRTLNVSTKYFPDGVKATFECGIAMGTYVSTNNIDENETMKRCEIEILCDKNNLSKFAFSTQEWKIGFITSMMTHSGYVDEEKGHISISNKSREIIEQVNVILKTQTPAIMSFASNDCDTYKLTISPFSVSTFARIFTDALVGYKSLASYEPTPDDMRHQMKIPNMVNGIVQMEDRNGRMEDVVFVQIKSIEEVPNTTSYAYDLTVETTRNFLIENGLAVNDTFHFAGVSSKSNATRGVPRIEEILKLSKNPKNSSVTISMPPGQTENKEKAEQMRHIVEHTSLRDIVTSVSICFDPDDMNTLIDEDKELVSQYKRFQEIVEDCLEEEDAQETEFGNWIIRFELNKEEMLEKNITMGDVMFAIQSSYKDEVSCVMSDYNSDKLIFRVRLLAAHMKKVENKKTFLDGEQVILDQSDEIYMLKNVQENLLDHIVLRGVKGITKAILRKVNTKVEFENGNYVPKDTWVLDTVGTNLLDILAMDDIDPSKTTSNHIVEIFNVLGMEAARQVIYDELNEVMEHGDTYVNYHHMALLCDRMCHSSKMISIFRHGINNDHIGPIAKASFEETPEMFFSAARHAEMDNMRGVSANVMCGQQGNYGTSAFQLVLDLKEMGKLGSKTIEFAKSLEEQFGMESKDDVCAIDNIKQSNNIKTIKAVDMGDDNDYNPGF